MSFQYNVYLQAAIMSTKYQHNNNEQRFQLKLINSTKHGHRIAYPPLSVLRALHSVKMYR